MKFNETSSQYWSSDPQINRLFLENVRNYMRDKLQMRGHVFLNEVFDQLGMPRTREGQIVGWRAGSVIQFWDELPEDSSEDISLKFNVDGEILDAIEQ